MSVCAIALTRSCRLFLHSFLVLSLVCSKRCRLSLNSHKNKGNETIFFHKWTKKTHTHTHGFPIGWMQFTTHNDFGWISAFSVAHYSKCEICNSQNVPILIFAKHNPTRKKEKWKKIHQPNWKHVQFCGSVYHLSLNLAISSN